MELRCWYCDKTLGPLKILKRDLFCCTDHEKLYFSEQSAIAFERVKETNSPAAPAPLSLQKEEASEQPAADSPESPSGSPVQELESPLPLASFLKNPIKPIKGAHPPPASSEQVALDPQHAPLSLPALTLEPLPVVEDTIDPIENLDQPPVASLITHPIEPLEGARPSPPSTLSQDAHPEPVPIEPQQIPMPAEGLLPVAGSVRMDWNLSPLDNPGVAVSACEPLAFLEDSVLAYRTLLPWHQPELDLSPCEEDEATDRPGIADYVAIWGAPASTSPAPLETAVPLTSQISAAIGQAQGDWRAILTLPISATSQLTIHPAAIEPTFDALAEGPTIEVENLPRFRATWVADAFELTGIGRFGWDLAICPPAIYASPAFSRDIEECAARLWIKRVAPVIATARLAARVVNSLLADPVRIDDAQEFVSTGWTGTSLSAPAIQPIASLCLDLRPAAAASYQVIGPNPARREITSPEAAPNWIHYERPPAIPRLGGPNRERSRDAGYLPQWSRATPLRTWPESAVAMSGHVTRAATAIFSDGFKTLNPLTIVPGDSRTLEWTPLEANGSWTHAAAPGFSPTHRLAIGRPGHAGKPRPRRAENVDWRKPPVDDGDAVLHFNPRWALASAAQPRAGRIARTLFTVFRRENAIVHTSLHARPSEVALSFAAQVDLWEVAKRIPVIAIRALAYLRPTTSREGFIAQDRFVSLVAATPLPRIARHGGLNFPQTSAADPVGLVCEYSKNLFLPSMGIQKLSLKPLVERPPSPALLVAIPVRIDRMEAALSIGAPIETLGLRPQWGKLHLGMLTRLKRDTEIARLVAAAIRVEPAARATHIATGSVKLLLEPRNARIESRIEAAAPVRVTPASIFGLPPLPAVTTGEMPRPRSIDLQGFVGSTHTIPSQVPGPSAVASNRNIPGDRTKAPTPDLKPLWQWDAKSSTEAPRLNDQVSLEASQWTLDPRNPFVLSGLSHPAQLPPAELHPERCTRYSLVGFAPVEAAKAAGLPTTTLKVQAIKKLAGMPMDTLVPSRENNYSRPT